MYLIKWVEYKKNDDIDETLLKTVEQEENETYYTPCGIFYKPNYQKLVLTLGFDQFRPGLVKFFYSLHGIASLRRSLHSLDTLFYSNFRKLREVSVLLTHCQKESFHQSPLNQRFYRVAHIFRYGRINFL